MSAKCQKRTYRNLFDHLVGDGEHACGNGEAERPGSRAVDDELEFGCLQHRQVSRLSALENAAGIDADLMKHVRDVASVAHQATGSHKFTARISRWNPVARRQDGKLHPAIEEECVAGHHEGIGAFARTSGKDLVYLANCTGIEDLELQPHGGGSFLHLP